MVKSLQMTMGTILILVIFFNISLGTFVLMQNPRCLPNQIFSLIGLFAAIWTFASYMAGISSEVLWLKSTYAFGSIVIFLGLIWALVITKNQYSKKIFLLLAPISLFFFVGSYCTNFIILNNNTILPGGIFLGGHGLGLTMYTIYYLITAFFMLWIILDSKRKATNKDQANQLKYILIGMISSLTISAFSSFILPHFSIFLFLGIDNIGFLLFLIFVTYSITEYNFFNIKIIAAEIVIFILWALILTNILLTNKYYETLVFSISALFVTIILGILLIRSILHSMQQDKKIDKLTSDLSSAYLEITELKK